MIKLKFLNKTIKNQRFKYSPIYYDERKRSLEHKKHQYENLKKRKLSSYKRKEILKDSIQENWNRIGYKNKSNQISNIRILILIIILFGLVYFLFNGVNGVDTVVNKIW